MYAVIETGGKQYRVSQGQLLKIETLPVEEGQTVEFDKILLVADEAGQKIGTPYVAGGKVTASVVQHGRHPKIRIIKMRRRKHYRRQAGHRQDFVEIRIDHIQAA